MPVAVPLIGAAATIGGAALIADSTSSAAESAANAQTAANDKALAQQQAQYQQTRSDLMPYQTAGQQALASQSDLLGLNGTAAQQAAIAAQKSSPLYQSLFDNGQNTLLANASATGGLRGGNTQSSLANFGRDTLAGVIQNQLSNLSGLSEQGQNAAAQTGNFGAGAANAATQLLNNSGAAQANAAYTVGGANAALINSITGAVTGLSNNQSVQNFVGKIF